MNKYIVEFPCRPSIIIEAVWAHDVDLTAYFYGEGDKILASVRNFDYWAKLPQPLNIKTEDK